MLVTIITKHNEEVCRVKHNDRDVLCISGYEKEGFNKLFMKHDGETHVWEILFQDVRRKKDYDMKTIY